MHATRQTLTLSGRTFVLEKLPAAESLALLAELILRGLPLSIFGDDFAALFPGALLQAEKPALTAAELTELQQIGRAHV